jgi:hypothetical protein
MSTTNFLIFHICKPWYIVLIDKKLKYVLTENWKSCCTRSGECDEISAKLKKLS